jgi:hypothetical protein
MIKEFLQYASRAFLQPTICCWKTYWISSRRGSLTCRKELPANKSHHKRCEQFKAYNLWKMPPQSSSQVAAKAII